MSGRAYARNPDGSLGGATDIHSFIPHRFRLTAPKVTNRAKEQAIRRAIQRKCREKNWKKMLRLRRTRLVPLEAEEEDEEEEVGRGEEESGGVRQEVENRPTKEEKEADGNAHVGSGMTAEKKKKEEEERAKEKREKEAEEAKQKEKEELERAKQQLKEMEEKLEKLSHEKHEKFQQLKELLMVEARAKSTPTPVKKRRLDSIGSVSAASPRLGGASEGASSPLPPLPGLTRGHSHGSNATPEKR